MVLPYKWFRLPFGVAGTLAAIPDATQPDGTVSYNEGFGADYALDPATNPAALNIPRDKTNQLYNDITTALQWLQAGNIPAWISAADNGGSAYSYGFLAKVRYTDGFVYTSVAAANTTTPGASATWVRDRIRLGASTTFYVSTAGSDSTGDGSSGNPWRTGQFAVNTLFNNYDVNSQSVSIFRQAGSYTDPVALSGIIPGQTSPIIFDGVGSGSVTVTTTNANCYAFSSGARATVQNQKVVTSGSPGFCISATTSAIVRYGSVEFGAASARHLNVDTNSSLTASGNYTISGGSISHVGLSILGAWLCNGITVTLVGTPNFSGGFVNCDQVSIINSTGVTWSGAATGARYLGGLNSVINTSGGGANYFPGNSAGALATGAQYV